VDGYRREFSRSGSCFFSKRKNGVHGRPLPYWYTVVADQSPIRAMVTVALKVCR